MESYRLRSVDRELDDLLASLPAVAIEGPKGVGKTATAVRRAGVTFPLDDPRQLELIKADPERISRTDGLVLIDEWQRHPPIWDVVRRSVDNGAAPGRYLLAGSAVPVEAPMHSGAGRIEQIRMRPMSLAERGIAEPTVSLRSLLTGERRPIDGECAVDLPQYADEIERSGFPGIRHLRGRALRTRLDGYVARIVQRDFPDQGHPVRRHSALRAWLAAYAAATATMASYNAILDAATPGEEYKPSRATTIAYREILTELWMLDPVPGWLPVNNALGRLAQAPKHHLADPALAARLLGVDAHALLQGRGSRQGAGTLIGQLFESLVTQSLKVYAQDAEATVHHMRTRNGEREVDLIVERGDRRVVAVEVKLAQTVSENDVKQLRWLADKLGDALLDAVVLTTGPYAYRRPDGIAVLPAALLGP